MALIEKLTAIADAIRAKTGKSEKLTLDQMVEEVGGKLVDKKFQDSFYGLTDGGTDFSYAYFERPITKIPEIDTSNGINFVSMFDNCISLTEIPALDTSNGTYFTSMFYCCESLTEIPALDTSNGTYFASMFYNCNSLTKIPALDTSNGTDFGDMFYNCISLTEIPALDTSNGTDFFRMFGFCESLETIGLLDLSNAERVNRMFTITYNLTNITMTGTINITDIKLLDSPLLSHESIMSFVNALVDNSETSETKTIYFGSTNLAKLTEEELAIMDLKNWNYA